jgi:phenol/toluene 2-monooxygenase (NADH) P0/A0
VSVPNDIIGSQTDFALGDFGASGFDTERRFVHVKKRHENGLVQFEFSIGTPDFSVELMLPQPAFDEFCARHQAVFVHDEVKQPGMDE